MFSKLLYLRQREALFSPSQRPWALDGSWFQKVFWLSFAVAGAFMACGKAVFSSPSGVSIAESSMKTPAASVVSDVVFPSFPVSLKAEGKPFPALMEVHVKTDGWSASREIISKKERFQRHLLILLSGRSLEEFQDTNNVFEEKARSQLNAFISKGAISKLRFYTALLH